MSIYSNDHHSLDRRHRRMPRSRGLRPQHDEQHKSRRVDAKIQRCREEGAARKYASSFMKTDVKGYSQWFPGKSRDWHLGDDEFTLILRSNFLKQTTENFQISPLPSEISSWVISLLLQPLPSFPPCFSIASDKQPVHTTKLESSSKNPYVIINSEKIARLRR